MVSSIDRMQLGAHRRNICGSNTSGFSAINALPVHTDLHTLDNALLQQTSSLPTGRPKTKMLPSHVLAYLLTKMFSVTARYTSYTFFLRSQDSIIPGNLLKMICYMSQSALVYTVSKDNDSYSVISRFRGQTANINISSFDELTRTMRSMNDRTSSMYIVYPELTDEYISLLNSLNKCTWCVPSSRGTLYLPMDGISHCSIHVYPWSTSKSCSGYVLGQNKIRRSSTRETNLYIGAFGQYESLISCVPYKGSCPDCYEMNRSAVIIASMTDTITTTLSERRLSSASMTVLERMASEFKKHCNGVHA
jgi:hypothetical protein